MGGEGGWNIKRRREPEEEKKGDNAMVIDPCG